MSELKHLRRIQELHFPDELPVCAKRATIEQAIQSHQVIIVCGETGSGKTTQLPKICLNLGRGWGAGGSGLIGHTQPRRIAAKATAQRIADELGSSLGEHVGYKVRFHDQLSRGASIKLMTDGILLAETQSDRLLAAYDTIILDEAHERSLNIDFLLGYLQRILPQRPDLKVIVTSATIDAERFSKHFNHAPVIEVSGRLYPVEIRHRPVQVDRDERDSINPMIDAIIAGVAEADACGPGDVLVFLPGEGEIREAAEALRKHHPPHVEILPLFARLSSQEQQRIFKTTNARRIVLATNVAETSLTVPGIRYVVDTGLARVKRYSYRNKVEQLQVEAISQAAANQRAGRCGRVAAGVCIRLYEESDFQARPAFTDPEILRSSLAAVILRMKSLRLGEADEFPFLERPSGRAIADGYQLLNELGALDAQRELTPLGKELAHLPLDPRIARMILAARDYDCLHEVLIIASALSIANPRERPLEQQAAADQAHGKFADDKSDFVADLKLWNWFSEAVKHKKSNRQLQDVCRGHFISQLRLREWQEVHRQLLTIVAEKNWRMNQSPATYEQIHCALLTGLLGNIGCKADEDAHYLGARGIKFLIWPGSRLAKKTSATGAAGKWVVAAELVETTRLYARTVARIDPLWLERIAGHLLKKSYSDPHWQKKSAQVSAYERATLYGLVVYSQRRVDYSRLNPQEARSIFIREALVAGLREDTFNTRAAFFAHNQGLIAELEKLEHKTRRPDVLVDDQLMIDFYEREIPQEVVNGASFEKWIHQASQANPRVLFLNREELMRHEAAGVTSDLFPKTLAMGGAHSLAFHVDYHFEPGSERDGVTMMVPVYAINQIDAARCDWLVPGMIKDKVQYLLKSLPQKLRRHCVPLPEYAAGFCERNQKHQQTLIATLIADLRAQRSLQVQPSDFKLETLAPHHQMNFKIVDEHGRQLALGRNLAALRAQCAGAAQNQIQQAFAQQREESLRPTQGLRDWSFGELEDLMQLQQSGQTLVGYPALIDHGNDCELALLDDPDQAAIAHRAGLRRLFALQYKEQIKFLEKNLPGLQAMAMQFMSLGSLEELREQIITAAIQRACLAQPWPRNAAQFAARVSEGKSRLGLLVNEIARLLASILSEYTLVQKKLASMKAHARVLDDLRAQLQALMGKSFISDTPYEQLTHYPRYLKAIAVRCDKLLKGGAEALARDTRCMSEIMPLQQQWQRVIPGRRDAMWDGQLQQFRWLLEELRVALFAQELRTPMPVSLKRLQKIWESQKS